MVWFYNVNTTKVFKNKLCFLFSVKIDFHPTHFYTPDFQVRISMCKKILNNRWEINRKDMLLKQYDCFTLATINNFTINWKSADWIQKKSELPCFGRPERAKKAAHRTGWRRWPSLPETFAQHALGNMTFADHIHICDMTRKAIWCEPPAICKLTAFIARLPMKKSRYVRPTSLRNASCKCNAGGVCHTLYFQ